MAKEHKQPDKKANTLKKQSMLRKAAFACIITATLIGILGLATLAYNNISLADDEAFAKRVDTAIEKCLVGAKVHKHIILERKNIALIMMLKEIDNLRTTPVISGIVDSFMSIPSRPNCWKRLVDPNWPVDELELNITIKQECLDNKWALYAIAPDKAKITPEQMHLFDPKRWRGRKLTHQLDALIVLRKTKGTDDELDRLIEYLCNRLSNELVFDIAVVDIYIQKVAFILRAGFPEKICRRWVERIIANQMPDGGWNDRWLCFTSERRPVLDLAFPPSNQHATVQALAALYLVRYRYPEQFNLK